MVTDLMTLGGGAGALNTPSSLCEFESLLAPDEAACAKINNSELKQNSMFVIYIHPEAANNQPTAAYVTTTKDRAKQHYKFFLKKLEKRPKMTKRHTL